MAIDIVLQIRIDKKTKDDVENLYKSMGLTFASTVRLLARQKIYQDEIFTFDKKLNDYLISEK